jgi:hypothetical protein
MENLEDIKVNNFEIFNDNERLIASFTSSSKIYIEKNESISDDDAR